MTPRRELGDGAWIETDAVWIAPREADRCLAALLAGLVWEQREIELFGKRILQPRLIAWAGAAPYRYSGQTLEPRAFTPALDALRQAVERRAGARFNHALVNRYRDGHDSMGWHADDEPELGVDPVVASVSFGASRRFVLRHKKKKGQALEVELGHGALCVMGGTCQRFYRHAVPRTRAVVGERVSVTWRLISA